MRKESHVFILPTYLFVAVPQASLRYAMGIKMKFEKKHLCTLPSCYAVSSINVDGRLKYVLATDDTGPCYSIDAETFVIETVWDGPGGTMSIIPIPGTNGEFLATQYFLPGFSALDSRIVRVCRKDGIWEIKPWITMPYVHRFDILNRNGIYYLLCCILTATDKPQADWNFPGKLLAAELSGDFAAPGTFTLIAEGMTRNHGYCRVQRDGYTEALTACDEGVFKVIPPERKGGAWSIKKVLETRASDVAVCDIDGDGIEEIATIEPFHGSDFVIYHKTPEGYAEIYRYPDKMDFVHVIWGGRLGGEPVFLGGCRAVNKEFFVLRHKEGGIHAEIIETGYGPSNVAVLPGKDREYILAANRESGEGALFTVLVD